MRKLWFHLLILICLLSASSQAEYRMFVLQVTNPDGSAGPQIMSNLDPDQYRGYHPMKEGEGLSYIDTWMCKGRTNEMPPCPNPRDPANQAASVLPPSDSTPAVLETPATPPPTPAEPASTTPP
jgi:hypothetical protein